MYKSNICATQLGSPRQNVLIKGEIPDVGHGCSGGEYPRVGLGSKYKQTKHPKDHDTLVFC